MLVKRLTVDPRSIVQAEIRKICLSQESSFNPISKIDPFSPIRVKIPSATNKESATATNRASEPFPPPKASKVKARTTVGLGALDQGVPVCSNCSKKTGNQKAKGTQAPILQIINDL